MEWGNLTNWLSGGGRDRELNQTREAYNEVEAAWRSSPLAGLDEDETDVELVREAMRRLDRNPAPPILGGWCVVVANLLRQEEITAMTPHWDAIDRDVEVAINFRAMLARRRRWATDYDRMMGIVRTRLFEGYGDFVRTLPESCFGDWKEGGLGVPLIELVEEPGPLISRLILSVYDDDVMRFSMFGSLRSTFERNMLVASGFAPTIEASTVEHRLVMPHLQKNKTPMELAEMYLAGTPYMQLMTIVVPFEVPDEARFEHCHIIGGTGHGKTQLMQKMIHDDLEAARYDGRGVIVIDSQGDLINRLVRLDIFDPAKYYSLSDRLVLIDPADVEFPAALNLFDAHLDRLRDYSPADRERVLNGVIELYEGFFGDLLGAELTQKQGVIFKYLARLMLAIPGANIHTLMQIMEDGKPFKPHMEQLDGSARYFFEREFFDPSFSATKKQILKRLWGVLSTPAFERMFAQKHNKLDLFEAMQEGKIILISTAKDLLKTEGSRLFGRFFVSLVAQAALERSTVDPDDRRPVHVYIDEAQEYFDENIETILNQARKYRVGLTLAHQMLDQLSPRLRSALLSNTSLKCVGGVSNRDARMLSDELRTTADFIESMKRRKDRTEFAVWLKHHTPQAIRLTVPLGYVEQQPLLVEEDYAALIERNRVRYCGTLADVSRMQFRTPDAAPPERAKPRTQEPSAEPEAIVRPSIPRPASEVEPTSPPVTNRDVRPTAAEARELGKGGSQHRYVQQLIKGLGEDRGFRAVIEEPVPTGQVDVALYRDGLSIACEISVTSKAGYEVKNLAKCLAGPFTRIFAIAADAARLRAIEALARQEFSEEELARIDFITSEDVVAAFDKLDLPPVQETVVKGYKVKVSRTAVSPAEAKERRAAVARVISKSMRGMKEP